MTRDANRVVFEDDAVVPYIDVVEPWPHQRFAVDTVMDRYLSGKRDPVVVATPTGGGKTYDMAALARKFLIDGVGVSILCNRKMLIEQMARSMTTFDMRHGIRAAGNSASLSKLQIVSVQTEHSRVIKRKVWDKHDCGLLLVDEAHMQTGKSARAVIAAYRDAGALVVGFTATPLDLEGVYSDLIVAGVTSELRACGALVPATHYGCSEPDLKNVKNVRIGEEWTDEQKVKAIMVPGIHGRVIDHFRRLNPHGLPSIGFAPGVPESVGFAEAFEAAGIPAAHIDGQKIWLRGRELPSNRDTRLELLELSRTGGVRIVWNRFVLREAIDMPWLRHGVFATVFGSLQSYLQSGGRLIRACAPVGKQNVVVQDHGGNWWRHGSLNADRHWQLGDTSKLLAQLRNDDLSGDSNDGQPKTPEPFLCPSCKGVLNLNAMRRMGKVRCPFCSHQFDFSRRSRPVIQADGSLIEHPGQIFAPKRTQLKSDTARRWEQCYWRAAKSGSMTFSQAVGLFYQENGYWPPRSLPLMPVEPIDWYRVVKSVPFTKLRPKDQ